MLFVEQRAQSSLLSGRECAEHLGKLFVWNIALLDCLGEATCAAIVDCTRICVMLRGRRETRMSEVSAARHKGLLFGVFARHKGPPNRQGHGTTVAGEKSKIAKVMGPPNRQGHGTPASWSRRRKSSIADRQNRQTP